VESQLISVPVQTGFHSGRRSGTTDFPSPRQTPGGGIYDGKMIPPPTQCVQREEKQNKEKLRCALLAEVATLRQTNAQKWNESKKLEI
jgi:hypothetical protein